MKKILCLTILLFLYDAKNTEKRKGTDACRNWLGTLKKYSFKWLILFGKTKFKRLYRKNFWNEPYYKYVKDIFY